MFKRMKIIANSIVLRKLTVEAQRTKIKKTENSTQRRRERRERKYSIFKKTNLYFGIPSANSASLREKKGIHASELK